MPNNHAARLFIFPKIFPPTRLIRTYTLINFGGKFLPTILKSVGKIIFYLVPTQLLWPTRLSNSKKLSHLHAYLELTLIRDLRVTIKSMLFLSNCCFYTYIFTVVFHTLLFLNHVVLVPTHQLKSIVPDRDLKTAFQNSKDLCKSFKNISFFSS